MTDLTNPLIAALEPLVRRVRTDVTAIKRADGSRWTREPLTVERLAAHLNGGPARGVCAIKPGESVTLVGLLDFDSHRGEVTWPAMSEAVGRVVDALVLGWGMNPILFRSSGGAGVHLYLLWDEPQDAYSVREFLRDVLASVGLEAGTGGLGAGQVEVFPKQDAVPAGGMGNQAILPLAGRSEWLELDDLSGLLVGRDRPLQAADWMPSAGVPRREKPVRTAVVGPAASGAWVQALDALRNGAGGSADLDYDQWRSVVFAIHHETGGSDEGLEMAHRWSARSSKYDAAFLDNRVWPYVHSDRGSAVVTGGTIMSLAARLHGWTEPLSADDFPVLDERGRVVREPEANYGHGVDVPGGGGGGPGAGPVGGLGHAPGGLAGPDDRRGHGEGAGEGVGEGGGVRGGVRGGAGDAGDDLVGDLTGLAPGSARGDVQGRLEGSAGRGEGRGAGVAGARRAVDATAGHREPVERRGIPAAQHLCTDQANANRLVRAYGSRVLVAAGKWYAWDGRRWLADEADVYRYACRLSALVREEAREVLAKAQARMAGDGSTAGMEKARETAEALEKWSTRSESKASIEAAVGLARKMLTVEAEALDADPWLLNVRNGVVDLRTGQLGPHRPELLLAKLADVEYRGCGADVACREWERAVEDIAGGGGPGGVGERVAGFLRRWFGYCLTGDVREQVFVVHWGDGSNGKSTVLDVVARVMGDYAGTAAPGLMADAGRGGERHPTEVADLRGRRMVTAHETREGVQLREDFVKQATGGDRIKARHMREDFFEFSPTHKLQLLTNAKPVVRGQDHGIWRRVRMVAYAQRYGTEEEVRAGLATRVKDMDLMQRLVGSDEALSGVLGWLVRGCIEWREGGGLREPAEVVEASEGYRLEQDRVGQWVRECCEVGPAAGEGAIWEALTLGMSGLYPNYVGWAREAGYHALARGRFVHELHRVVPGCRTAEAKERSDSGARRKILRVYGVRLLPED